MDSATILLISWAVATLGGVTASIYGYITSPNRFSNRKFAVAVITGVLGGLIFGIVNASTNPVFKDPSTSMFDVIYQLGLVFVAAIGIDFIRNRTGDAIKAPEQPV